jgi:transposase-like protein
VNITDELEPNLTCPKCKSDLITVTALAEDLHYGRCHVCGHQWNRLPRREQSARYPSDFAAWQRRTSRSN